LNDEDNGRLKSVLIGLGALLGVSLLIGAVVSAVALGVADVAGFGGDEPQTQATAAETTLVIPSPSPSPSDGPTEPKEPASTDEPPEPEQPETTKSEPARREITLSASPTRVSTFERINLEGSYRDAPGATLQVQRFEGGWADFPTSVTVEGGTFATYVESGQTGPNRFRVIDNSNGEASNPVTVNVG